MRSQCSNGTPSGAAAHPLALLLAGALLSLQILHCSTLQVNRRHEASLASNLNWFELVRTLYSYASAASCALHMHADVLRALCVQYNTHVLSTRGGGLRSSFNSAKNRIDTQNEHYYIYNIINMYSHAVPVDREPPAYSVWPPNWFEARFNAPIVFDCPLEEFSSPVCERL